MKDLVSILKAFANDVEKETRLSKDMIKIEVSSRFYSKLVENLTISNTLHQSDIGSTQVTIYTGVAKITVVKRD